MKAEDAANTFLHWLVLCASISLFAVVFVVLAKFLIAIFKGTADWRDLFCTVDGKIASKKVWMHIASGVFTFAVLKDSLDGKVDVVLLSSYMGIVGGFEVAAKILSVWKPQGAEK